MALSTGFLRFGELKFTPPRSADERDPSRSRISNYFRASKHDVFGVTHLIVKILLAWTSPDAVYQKLTREGSCPFYQIVRSRAFIFFSDR